MRVFKTGLYYPVYNSPPLFYITDCITSSREYHGCKNSPSSYRRLERRLLAYRRRRCPCDGRFIENLGLYDPRHSNEKLNLERAEYWLSVGATASDTVKAIIKRAKEGKPVPAAPAPIKNAAPAAKAVKAAPAEDGAEAAAPAADAEA